MPPRYPQFEDPKTNMVSKDELKDIDNDVFEASQHMFLPGEDLKAFAKRTAYEYMKKVQADEKLRQLEEEELLASLKREMFVAMGEAMQQLPKSEEKQGLPDDAYDITEGLSETDLEDPAKALMHSDERTAGINTMIEEVLGDIAIAEITDDDIDSVLAGLPGGDMDRIAA